MRRARTLALILLASLAAGALCASAARAGSLKDALLEALKQAREQAREQAQAASDSARHDDDAGREPAAAAQAAPPRTLDSLLRLAAQDVGINPDEGSVQRAIWRVRVIKLNLATARRSLDNMRQEIFNLAANGEELKALKELDERRATAPDSLDGELLLERRRLQDAAIDQARRDGRLQQKRLGADQARRVGLLLYNLGVGVLCDRAAIEHAQSVVDDFTRLKEDLGGGKGWEGAAAWISLINYRQEFFAIPVDMGRVIIEAPAQLGALGAMIGTARVLKENNAIEEREAQPGDRFEELEDF
jgi:hypothetical protein